MIPPEMPLVKMALVDIAGETFFKRRGAGRAAFRSAVTVLALMFHVEHFELAD